MHRRTSHLVGTSSSITHTLQHDDQTMIDAMFQYIRKNKFIPNALAAIRPDDEHLQQLRLAIQHGEHQAAIFSNKQCYVYLLYLIKNRQIPFWQGITAYFHLMTLMQHTTKQDLRAVDNDVKVVCDIGVDLLVSNNRLTVTGANYLSEVCKHLNEIGVACNVNDMARFALSLPKSECWLFRLPYKKGINRTTLGIASVLLAGISPQLVKCDEGSTGNIKWYWTPSATLYNYFTQLISPNPMRRLPIFGSIGLATLAKLHAKGLHPYPLYAPNVSSNLKDADGHRCGAVLNALHDDAHTIWGNMLSPIERNIIFDRYVPQLRMMLARAKQHGYNAVGELIESIITNTCDLELLSKYYFLDPATRLSQYIVTRFWMTHSHTVNHVFNTTNTAQFISLINDMYTSVHPNTVEKQIWKSILLKALHFTDAIWSKPSEIEAVMLALPREEFPIDVPSLQHPYQVAKPVNYADRLASSSSSTSSSSSSSSNSSNQHQLSRFEEVTNPKRLRSSDYWPESATRAGTEFYMVGKPIAIKRAFLNGTLLWTFRETISDAEVQQSFPTHGNVKLFETERIAREFAKTESHGNKYHSKDYACPAVFKVKLCTDVSKKNKIGCIHVVEKDEHQSSSGMSRVGYLEVDANAVRPLEGTVHLDSYAHHKSYPTVDLSSLWDKIPGIHHVERLFSIATNTTTPTEPAPKPNKNKRIF